MKEGLVSVRGDNVRQPSPELQRLKDLEEQAKKERKGKWDDSVNPEVRCAYVYRAFGIILH